jgi:predicted nucleotidyltransferase
MSFFQEVKMGLSEKDREKIIAWATRHPEIKAAYLYGSRARGNNQPSSDIDIGIVLNRNKGDNNTLATWVAEASRLKDDLIDKLSTPLDLQWYDIEREQLQEGEASKVYDGVQADGILLYSE